MSLTMKKWKVTKSGASVPSSPKLRPRAAQKARAVPRQDSQNAKDPRNCTSFQPDQAEWSWESLPDILYQLKPEGKTSRLAEPPIMPYHIHGRRLREFPVLPDNISSTVDEFRVEAWMRLDRRIRLKDITDRMHPEFRVNENALQQRGVRFRQAFGLIAWDSGNKRSRMLEAELEQKMEAMGLDPNSNSTRGITPGLVDPKLGEMGGRIPLPAGWGAKRLGAGGKKTTRIQGQLPKEPEVSKHEAHMIEYVKQFVPYDEYHNHLNGALPVIQGAIPDEQLPSTVDMKDIDLCLGITFPEPQLKQAVSTNLLSTQHGFNSSIRESSPVFSLPPLCSETCFKSCSAQTEETLQPTHPSLETPSRLQTPTTGIFPIVTPVQLSTIPEQAQGNLFDQMLDEYYIGERQLVEMPYDIISTPCEW